MASVSATATPPSSSIISTGPEWFLKYLAGLNPKEQLTPEKTAELMTCTMKYGGAFLLLIVSSITIYVASTDDKALTEGFFKYMVFLIVPIVIASFIVLPIFSQKMNRTTMILNGIHLIVFILAIYVFYQTKSPESVWFLKYAIYGFTVLFLIVALAIVYKIIIRYIYNSRSWGYVIIQLIFYIPCLLLDFIEYLKNELKIAPNTTYILFAVELAIILLYFLIVRLSKYVPKTTTKALANDPVFLNNVTELADSSTLSIEPTEDTAIATQINYRANYSVSFWAFINQPTEPITVFLLGDPQYRDGSNNFQITGKPRVMYENGQYTFYLTARPEKSSYRGPQFKMSLPSQKWNHFVISYDENKVNVFINGNLEKTYKFATNEQPTYTNHDVISVGSNIPNKNVGAICNVQYYTVPVGQYEVITEYNLLMMKTPPVR
jgi:hypothetical protein